MKTTIILKALTLSIITSALLVGCGGGGGGGDDSSSSSTTKTTTTETPTPTTSDLSGNVVDGYVKGATVTVGSRTTTTNDKGFWELLDVENASTYTIEAKGGTDVSTGEDFEGVLKAPVPSDSQKKIALTPLTTVVASIVESGISVEEATTKVAKSLGVSEEALTADPIEKLANGTPEQKAQAAKVIKKSLVVQKMAETITKSVSSTDEHHDVVFDTVMDSVAKALTETTTDANFDEVITDTKTITDKVVTQIKEDKTIVIENLEEKLEASIQSAKSVVDMVQAFDETKLAEATDTTAFLETQAKAIEVVTSTIEKAVEKIAQATDVEALVDIKAQAEKTTNAITMLGGVDGIASKMEEQSAKLDNTQTLDASNFTDSFLSDEVIATQSDTFDTLVDSGMTDEMIADVADKMVTTTDATPDIASIVEEVVTQAEEAGTIESGAVDTAAVATEVESASEAADTAADTAGEVAAVVDTTTTETTGDSTETTGDETATTGDETATTGDSTETTGDETATTGDTTETTGDETATTGDTTGTSGGSTGTSGGSTGTSGGSSSSGSSSSSSSAPATQTVAVNATGSSDASSSDSTYNFTAGTYTYTISGFAAGDVLHFPAGNTPTIINSNLGDANVTVQWANGGNIITVNLTGMDTTKDATIYGMTSFNSAYTGAITQATAAASSTIEVAGNSSSAYDASTAAKTFEFNAGTYTYAISGFTGDDVLDFPEGNTPTVINDDFTDGNVTIQWANSGSVITVNLTNITGDNSIYGLDTFKSTIGANTVQ